MNTPQQSDVLPESSIPPANRFHPGESHQNDQDRPDLDAFAARLGMTDEAVAANTGDADPDPASEDARTGPVATVANVVLHATGEDRERLREHRDELLANGRHLLSGVLRRAANIVMSVSRTLDRAAESVGADDPTVDRHN